TSPATAIFSFSDAARSRLFRSVAHDGDGTTERMNGDLRGWRRLLIFRIGFSLLLDLAPVGTGWKLAAAAAA
ncbi:hypothetical protein HAX54_005076, partial [Datura stramonium]|nr:hypothetical protein [Datura stramonium]